MDVRFGLAALSNRHFDQALVPIGTRHDQYLPRYEAAGLRALELSHLYHAPEPGPDLLRWAEQAGPDFRFPVKLWKDAVAPEVWDDEALDAADQALGHLDPLADRTTLGPVVAQFPPRFDATEDRLDWLADLLKKRPPQDAAWAVEFRHPSWFTDAIRDLLKRRRAMLVLSTFDKALAPLWPDAEQGYVRFTGRYHKSAKTRGRAIPVADRLDDILRLRTLLAEGEAAGWDACTVIVTNPFEGNAVDSLPRIVGALGDGDLGRRLQRRPGEPLLSRPVPGVARKGQEPQTG